jgi:predicted nucleic-acid-binding protein
VIGVDTNILLRLATNDDPAQVSSIKRWLATHARGELLYVNHVVLAEAIWTLKSAYRADRQKIDLFVDALLGNAGFELEDAATVEDALRSYREGNFDFPDCLIAAKNARRCDLTITFDKGAASLPHFTLLK